jgi:hypothetical protein
MISPNSTSRSSTGCTTCRKKLPSTSKHRRADVPPGGHPAQESRTGQRINRSPSRGRVPVRRWTEPPHQRRQRRQRLPVHLARWRDPALRLPAHHGGQHPHHDVVDVYRNHPLFKDLRDVTKLKGKCGILRIPRRMRRPARPGLRRHRRLSGNRPGLYAMNQRVEGHGKYATKSPTAPSIIMPGCGFKDAYWALEVS